MILIQNIIMMKLLKSLMDLKLGLEMQDIC
jgi:hypothetical protein